MVRKKRSLMIVVGEASGDSLAADLVTSLRKKNPELTFFGSTGKKLRQLEVETIVKADELGIIGVLEIAKALPMFLNVFKKLKKEAQKRKPDAVILVDFPEFNLKLAKTLKKSGLKVIYYVSPQLWAWRSYRVNQVKKYVDLMLTILPFEKDWYSLRGFEKVEFVGHPLIEKIKPTISKQEFLQKHALDEKKPLIALLPGSRRKEISFILPKMLEAVSIIYGQNEETQFVLALAPNRGLQQIEEAFTDFKKPLPKILTVENETWEAVSASSAAIVASGTATLETGLLETPLVIVYRVSNLNYHLLKNLINVEHFGLINLVAEERLAEELIQNDCSGEKIAEEVLRILEPQNNRVFREKLQKVKERLGVENSSEKAAEAILRELEKTKVTAL